MAEPGPALTVAMDEPALRNDSDCPARWLTIHARDGGFAAFLRGIRDGVEVAWDISAVSADGGLPASESIVRSRDTRVEVSDRGVYGRTP